MTSYELIGQMRDHLEDIRQWRSQLTDVMLTITGYSMDLTGVRGTTDRIPGGDALAMLAPWAPDANHGDDLPHPDQIITEWAHTIHDHHGQMPPRASWETHWRYLWDQSQRILESPWADAWQQDITALWWRLARLTGNAPRDETTQRGPLDCLALADKIPDDARLTPQDADTFWPGIHSRIKAMRSRNRPQLEATLGTPDPRGRYPAASLRHFHDTRSHDRTPKTLAM